MTCPDCHTGGDMHGTDYLSVAEDGSVSRTVGHRYDGAQAPSCESCHQSQVGIGSGNPYHEAHGTEILSCQTCHSVSYINCYDCHLERSEDDVPFYQLQEEYLGFYIGRNPLRSAERPYRYVPVRHVPTFPDLFQLYGEDVLDNFDALSTWTYATPHNIQRNTPQTASCETCHGNDALFLTPDKVRPDELQANLAVVVPSAPPLPEAYQFMPRAGEDGTRPGAVEPATPSVDPLDAPAGGSADPLDAPAGSSTDPLDAPAVDPLDAPPS
jgi:thiosulfate/3-mercaptopyruvate sulfurtransferase